MRSIYRFSDVGEKGVLKGTVERRILLFGAIILILVILISGAGVFSIMSHQGEAILGRGLKLAVESRAHLFEKDINEAVSDVKFISNRPLLVKMVVAANQSPTKREAVLKLIRAVHSLISGGFSELSLYDAKGKRLASAGSSPEHVKLSIKLRLNRSVRLIWHNGYLVRTRVAIKQRGVTVGYLSAVRPLDRLSAVFADLGSLGPTAEMVICGESASRMRCFPSRLHPKPILNEPKIIGGHLLPMALALAGHTGLVRTNDYRNRWVVAAFMPVSNTGLGMVLKIDASDLYSPIWRTLPFIVPALVFMVIVGTLLLHWVVSPLVRKVIESEAETRESHRLLGESEARLRTLFESVDDGIIVINTAGFIEELNPGAEEIFGYSKADVIGKNVSILMAEPERSQHDIYIARYLETGESYLIGKGRELTGKRKDGTTVPVDLRVNEVDMGSRRIFVGTMRDITERQRNDEHIRHLATHDSLTGLANRTLFFEQVGHALARSRRYGFKVAVLFLDLDGFKQVNDNYGHDAGDCVLSEFARRLREVIREEDLLARQGGDEFILALPQIDDLDQATVVAAKVQDAVRRPFGVGERWAQIGVSIGIAVSPEDGDNIDALLKAADNQMYTAKIQGKRRQTL